MKKLISLFLIMVIGLVVSGCTTAEKVGALEASYGIGKIGVKTFVSDEKREKYHTKELDKVVTGTYSIIKGISDEELDQVINEAALETDRELGLKINK